MGGRHERLVCGCTLARFLRHSVQALGVTTPRPRLLLDIDWVGKAELEAPGVPAEDESFCAGVPAVGPP